MKANIKPVMRTCVVTRENLPKESLVRVVRTPSGEVELDLTGKKNGRGAYLTKNKDVILKAKKHKILDKKLEVKVPDSLYEELEKILWTTNYQALDYVLEQER